jgi:hypothetical protein
MTYYKVYRLTALGQDGNQGTDCEFIATFLDFHEAKIFCLKQPDRNGWVQYEIRQEKVVCRV